MSFVITTPGDLRVDQSLRLLVHGEVALVDITHLITLQVSPVSLSCAVEHQLTQ